MFWDNFVHYCTKAGTSPNAVAKELGLSSGSVTAWKNGTTPRSSAVIKIANYFQIEIEDLINDKGNIKEKAAPVSGNDFSLEDIEFLKSVDLLNPAMQRAVVALSALDQETLERFADLAENFAKLKER